MKRLITIAGIAEGKKTRLVYFFEEKGSVISEEKVVSDKAESIAGKYPSAEFYEREIHDFFGVTFEGCPNIHKRLFKAEGDQSTPFRGGN